MLREAGVVDAGGAGLVELVRGLAAAAAGEVPTAPVATPRLSVEAVHQELSPYRYCTTFVVEGTELDSSALEAELERLGDSLLVVGDPSALKVHVHTDDPGAALTLGTHAGTIEGVEIADMHRQTEEREERLLASLPGGASRSAVVAVVAGEGNAPPVRGSRRRADRRRRPDDEPVHRRPARRDRGERRGRGRAAAEQLERRDDRRAGRARGGQGGARGADELDPRRPRGARRVPQRALGRRERGGDARGADRRRHRRDRGRLA